MPQDFDQSSYATGHAGGAPADDGFGKTRNLFHFVFCLIVNGATDHVNYPENVAAATSTSVCWWLLVVKTIYITTIILIYFVCFSVLSSSCSCLWRCLVLIPHRHKTMCGVILAHPHPTPIFFWKYIYVFLLFQRKLIFLSQTQYERDPYVREYVTVYVNNLVWREQWTEVARVAREWLRWDTSNVAA